VGEPQFHKGRIDTSCWEDEKEGRARRGFRRRMGVLQTVLRAVSRTCDGFVSVNVFQVLLYQPSPRKLYLAPWHRTNLSSSSIICVGPFPAASPASTPFLCASSPRASKSVVGTTERCPFPIHFEAWVPFVSPRLQSFAAKLSRKYKSKFSLFLRHSS
jgi:hypothetical protein